MASTFSGVNKNRSIFASAIRIANGKLSMGFAFNADGSNPVKSIKVNVINNFFILSPD